VPHSAIIHHEQHNIRLRSANLKSETPTFSPHRGRGAPGRAPVATADREPAAFLRATRPLPLSNPAFLAGGGIKGSIRYGSTDDFGYAATDTFPNAWDGFPARHALLPADPADMFARNDNAHHARSETWGAWSEDGKDLFAVFGVGALSEPLAGQVTV
jgi:hypothetical protein